MPGFNRRGPDGMGPGTGRGMGSCAPADGGRGFGFSRGYGRGGAGRGMGRAMGIGTGLGMGYGFGGGRGRYNPAPVGFYGAARYEDVYPREDELKMLKDEAAFMEERVNGIKARIAELESADGDKN